jgi:hypothetical protein
MYSMKNSTFDLDALRVMPIEGYMWRMVMKYAAGNESNIVACLDIDATITDGRARPRKVKKP